MARVKRMREREPEAPEPTNKHHRAEDKKPQAPHAVPGPHLQSNNNHEVESGRPSSPSNVVSRLAPLHSPPPAQLAPEQPKQGTRPHPVLKLNPPKKKLPDPAGPSGPTSSPSETSTCYSQKAARYDVDPAVSATGDPETPDLERWGAVSGAPEFIRSAAGLVDGGWIGVRPLGKGGNGIAGLWEMRDGDGGVIKQMVVKEEAYLKNQWRRKIARGVPVEVKTMSKLNKVKCHAIPRLFNYKRYPLHYKHRMYMEYCPFNDLSVICERYRRFRRHFPEPFLWDTFYHLVEAAVAMRDGPENSPWGSEIVHRDLKPGNIFLGNENAEKGFPFYPVAKTGDFGLAVMTNAQDPLNPLDLQGPGTTGYFAPEQLGDETPGRVQPQLSSHTNVWAIGVTMYELVTLYSYSSCMQDASYHVDGKIIDIETNKETEYSDQLRKLVKRCIEPEPADRIGLNNLRAEIKAYRDRMSELYRRMSDTAKADFESEDRLYYIRNEINDMPTGSWEPYISSTPPEFEDDHFRDRSYPIIFPRFEDGPETKGGNDGDSDHDHDGDGDDVDKGDVQRARKPEAAKRTPPGSMSPRLLDPLFSDSSHQPPSLSLANSITDAIHSLGVSRSNNPIVVSSKIVNQSSGSSDIRPRRRARQAPYTQLRRGGAGDGGAGDGSLGDGGRASTRRGKDAIVPGVAAAREDGGIEGLEDRLTDGQASWAPSDGTDDGSQDMALESEDPVSPPPFGSRVLAPAPVPQAPLQPQPQPQPQPVPRRLRSGTTFGYF